MVSTNQFSDGEKSAGFADGSPLAASALRSTRQRGSFQVDTTSGALCVPQSVLWLCIDKQRGARHFKRTQTRLTVPDSSALAAAPRRTPAASLITGLNPAAAAAVWDAPSGRRFRIHVYESRTSQDPSAPSPTLPSVGLSAAPRRRIMRLPAGR